MLTMAAKIERAQRLVRMLEEDAPLLEIRVAELNPEHQLSAKSYAAQLTARARAVLERRCGLICFRKLARLQGSVSAGPAPGHLPA
jgi:hypothetical protein